MAYASICLSGCVLFTQSRIPNATLPYKARATDITEEQISRIYMLGPTQRNSYASGAYRASRSPWVSRPEETVG